MELKPPNVYVSRAEQPTRTLDCCQTIENPKCLLNIARVRRRLHAMLALYAYLSCNTITTAAYKCSFRNSTTLKSKSGCRITSE